MYINIINDFGFNCYKVKFIHKNNKIMIYVIKYHKSMFSI